jgi:hypothetical protein
LEAIIDSNIVLPSEEFLYMLKDMNVPISERGAVRLNTLISQLFLLNWDDSRKVSKWLSSIHLNQKQPLLNSLNDFESWIGQDSIKKGLFYQYLTGLTENMENSTSYQASAEVSLRIALHSSVDSFWFSEVFRRGSVSQIRLLLESKNMSLDKVPTTTLNRLQSGNTELLGWPSPYKKISSATKMQTRARLAIQPTRLDKANKMFGLSCHITFWLSTITFVLFLLDLIGIMNLNLKPPSMIDPPYYGLELPRYADFFSLTFALILSIHSYLYSKVTKKLR